MFVCLYVSLSFSVYSCLYACMSGSVVLCACVEVWIRMWLPPSVCVCLHVYVRVSCMYACTDRYVRMHVCVYLYIYVYVYMFAYVCLFLYACFMVVSLRVVLPACTYVCMFVCVAAY